MTAGLETRDGADALAALFRAVSVLNDLEGIIREQVRTALAEASTSFRPATAASTDGWLDSKAAARYMGVSRTTFDKYRYETEPKLKGHPLDGKILYKKGDIDSFIILYELKAKGLS